MSRPAMQSKPFASSAEESISGSEGGDIPWDVYLQRGLGSNLALEQEAPLASSAAPEPPSGALSGALFPQLMYNLEMLYLQRGGYVYYPQLYDERIVAIESRIRTSNLRPEDIRSLEYRVRWVRDHFNDPTSLAL
jgi:hypothetical protein